MFHNAQNPLDTIFPPHSIASTYTEKFNEVANLSRTCLVGRVANKSVTRWQQVVVVEFGTQQTQQTFARDNLLRTCYGKATGKLVVLIQCRLSVCPSVCLSVTLVS